LGDGDEGLQRLSGYISYVHSADPAYLDKLRRKFGSTVIDSFLHKSAQ
jgi:RNA-directed DNA polymerase